jgi:hypothetical protein
MWIWLGILAALSIGGVVWFAIALIRESWALFFTVFAIPILVGITLAIPFISLWVQ